MADLTFKVAPIDGIQNTCRVQMSGAIDASTVVNFQANLEKLKAEGTKKFLLDMEGIRYVNSTGLGSLVKLADVLETEGGAIVLIKIHPKVKVVFDMLGLNAFFRIFNSDEEAVKHLKNLPALSARAAAAAAPLPALSPMARPAPVSAHSYAAPAPAPTSYAGPVTVPSGAPAGGRGGPFTVICSGCRIPLRVPEPGGYRCPRCLAVFRVGGDGAAQPVPERRAHAVHLTLTGSDPCVEGLRGLVASLARGAGLPPDAVRSVQSSVDEVVRAILDKAYGGNRQRSFSVFLAAGSGELALTFTDTGQTLDGQAPFSTARSSMDQFAVKAHPRGGNVLTMSKRA